ncbi:hypothetical protein ACWD04_33045 [Streptomyces sp. NPDC002911]
MRTRIKLVRAGESFHGRLTSSQTDLMLEALQSLKGWGPSPDALSVQLGVDLQEVDRLAGRLRGDHRTTREFTLTARELHVSHSALTAVPPRFAVDGVFSEEGFYNRTSFFRENFDAMATGIVAAVSEAMSA